MSRGSGEAHCWKYPGVDCGVRGAAGDTLSNFAFFLMQNLLLEAHGIHVRCSTDFFSLLALNILF